MANRAVPAVDVLEVIDSMLSAALREVRRARAKSGVPDASAAAKPRAGRRVRTSNTESCLDILKSTGRPLHITALLAALERRGVRTTRESLVSAISKRLAPSGPFVRTAGNTFGLLGRDAPEER